MLRRPVLDDVARELVVLRAPAAGTSGTSSRSRSCSWRPDAIRRPVGGKLAAVRPQPRARVGAGPVTREQLPERPRVVGDAQVAELVADDVVEHPGRSEQEAPRERERAARRAGAPARALVAHGDRRGRDADAPVPAARSRPRARRARSSGTSARAPPRRRRCRVRAARALRRSSRRSARRAVTTRSGTASPPCHATPAAPGRELLVAGARGRARARARASSARPRSPSPRALAGTTSSGPTPGTSTSRRRRARDERRSRTFTAPLRRSTVRSPSTAGRLCGVRAEQITEPLALHGEGPCWLERSGRARVGRHAGGTHPRDLAGDRHDARDRRPWAGRGAGAAARGRRARRRQRDGRRAARRARRALRTCARSSTSRACA